MGYDQKQMVIYSKTYMYWQSYFSAIWILEKQNKYWRIFFIEFGYYKKKKFY